MTGSFARRDKRVWHCDNMNGKNFRQFETSFDADCLWCGSMGISIFRNQNICLALTALRDELLPGP
jgi:hypothetical protein